MKKIFGNVVASDSGARGATTSFVQRGQGDVLIAWENEALFLKKGDPDAHEIFNAHLQATRHQNPRRSCLANGAHYPELLYQ